ncbi:hypothetical protein [Haloparvum sedimenti]|uniref:hypothetical protein n=1 Tax=Haloparvum sedimenti TaxID=1678448 RepID=UPI00071E958B|nr:hypothetical protein [Haloparvum sedimenti]
MSEGKFDAGDAVLVEFEDGERVKGTIRERTKTHATIDVEKRFDSERLPTFPADETRVITLDQVLRAL